MPAALKLAFSYDNKVIIEECISGFEVGCAVLENDGLMVGEVDEIELEKGFFDFTEKYTLKTSSIHVPARISAEKAAKIKETAKLIYKTLDCRGFARVDMFLDDTGRIVFNEVNTIPGFTTHSRYHYAELLNAYGKPVKVHIKIDTGMHRLGERAEHIEEIARMFQMKNLIIEGAFTHLCADESISPKDRTFTEAQGKAFYQVISVLKEQGYSCPKVHLLASYGLINYPELSGDYARIGIALYGVLSNRSDIQKCKIPLLPVLSIKVRIAAIKDLLCGEGVGYGLSYTATENRKIAILPIGYADGIPRALSCGNGNVLINGSIAPIIGRICMDQTIIDVTDIPTVKEGDIAIIIGKSGNAEITAYDIAEQTGTITNEILSRLGSRLDRFII